jgi:hypothetical protein
MPSHTSELIKLREHGSRHTAGSVWPAVRQRRKQEEPNVGVVRSTPQNEEVVEETDGPDTLLLPILSASIQLKIATQKARQGF